MVEKERTLQRGEVVVRPGGARSSSRENRDRTGFFALQIASYTREG